MLLVENRKARQEYEMVQAYHAGIVLSGGEVRSLRKGSASFLGSYIKILQNQAFLLNAQITPYAFADNREYDPKRTRKLLLKKKEIYELLELSSQRGLAIIPIAFELLGNRVKLKFMLAKGKKVHERRAELKKRDIERDVRREIKDRVKIR